MSKIMIADDDTAIIDSLQLMLEEDGYDVETTVDGETARDMKQQMPDLLLLDVWMLGIDGRDICRHLKALETTRHIPIIMYSANADISGSVKRAGADEFMTKPFQMQELLKLVRRYVSN